jgi:Ser/Thr protein kinase RdoA (MazF antagonist)
MAHGLSGNLEAPDWPPLELREVNELLRQYPQAGSAIGILSHSPRPFSSASLVDTPRGTVFVKRHAGKVRSVEGLSEEHYFIEYLAGAFASTDRPGNAASLSLVQAPLRNRSGETSVCLGERIYEVHPQAHGLDIYEQVVSWQPFLSAAHAYAAGRALAQLHQVAKGFSHPARRPQQLVTSFTIFASPSNVKSAVYLNFANELLCRRMQDYLNSRPLLLDYAEDRRWQTSIRELFLSLYMELAPWLRHLEPLWTHNDFHASNMMWSADSDDAIVTSIVDFGLADRTNAIHDLATAIERNIVEWLCMKDASVDLVHFEHLAAILDGYESHSPLSYAQARALAAMLPLVHCEFALSETDYFLSILHSEAKAYLAYEGYFLGHTQWFLSTQGQTLLSWLREWANRHPHASGEGR